MRDPWTDESEPPTNGPCAGEIPVSARLPWIAYQRRRSRA